MEPCQTCHPTQANTARLYPSQTGWYSIYRPFKDGDLPLWVASDGFDSWTDALRSVVPLHTLDRHLICHWWCRPCMCSRADSDQNATGQVWYGLTEAADFQEVRYRVVKLQGLCLVQNSFLLLRLLDCRQERYVVMSAFVKWSESKSTFHIETHYLHRYNAKQNITDIVHWLQMTIQESFSM